MTIEHAPVGVVILAAGRGTRFGEAPKLLAPLDGRPLVRHAAEAARASSLAPVVVVLGHAGEAVRAVLGGLDLAFVENPDHREGLSTSLRAGLNALPAAIDGAVIALGDMPRIPPGLLDDLAASFRADPDTAAVVPVSDGRRGNPVLLNRRRLASALETLTGDHGAGPLLRGRPDVRELPVSGAGVLADVDTPAALAALRAG